MDAATTAVSGLFYCCSSVVAVVTASDLTTTVVDANSSAKRGPLNEVPFSLYRKLLSCKAKKCSARMRTAAYKVDVASDRRRHKNVSRHILCSFIGNFSNRQK